MKLTSLKRPKVSEKKAKELATPWDGEERYPWGSKLEFDTEEVEKVPGLADLDVGDEVVIEGRAKVVAKSVNERQGSKGPSKRVELQVTEIGVSASKDFDQAFEDAGKG